MVPLIGTYDHSLDTKGRVILPVRFRPGFAEGGFLSQFNEGCLALWPPAEFDVQVQRWRLAMDGTREERNMARIWSSGSSEVEIDKSGRMPIPAFLRSLARLEPPDSGEGAPVKVIGAISHVELWNPSVWAETVAPDGERFVDSR